MPQKPLQILREVCQKEIGPSFDEATFQKAVAKARRWAKAAYGSADLQEFLNENGTGGIGGYYKECLKVPDGINTANRALANNTRRVFSGRKR